MNESDPVIPAHQLSPAPDTSIRDTSPSERANWSLPDERSFRAILAQARQRDQAALTAIFHRYLPVVYRYVAARVAHVQSAEDITSDTMLAILKGLDATRAEDELTFAGWILAIARNKVAGHFRWLRLHPETPLEPPEDAAHPYPLPLETTAVDANPLAVVLAREEWDAVVAALNRLTEVQREVVIYRCVLGYPTESIARLLGRRPDAIRALQHRALTSLARFMRAERPPDEDDARTTPGGGAIGHAP